ncbi:hypothetical protein [Microtetraspora glauca]|uniref:Uncharacterized protein n=1 Tax=Microtetraspora glauca TaxID=1996 RepID=A0ABV3GD77_MICGL
MGDFTGELHEFTSPKRKRSRRGDVTIHTSSIGHDEIVWCDQLPVTAPARLVGDLLADRHDGQHISHVVADILDQRLATRKDLADAVTPHAAAYGVMPAFLYETERGGIRGSHGCRPSRQGGRSLVGEDGTRRL